jgi:hypothetical protein
MGSMCTEKWRDFHTSWICYQVKDGIWNSSLIDSHSQGTISSKGAKLDYLTQKKISYCFMVKELLLDIFMICHKNKREYVTRYTFYLEKCDLHSNWINKTFWKSEKYPATNVVLSLYENSVRHKNFQSIVLLKNIQFRRYTSFFR